MKQVTSLEELELLFAQSADAAVLLFKHSTQCPISAAAYKQFSLFSKHPKGAVCAVVHVIEDRAVSDAIAVKTGVRHESPQALLIKHGAVVWHRSHSAISAETLQAALG